MLQSARNVRSYALGALSSATILTCAPRTALAQSTPPIPIADSETFLSPEATRGATPLEPPTSDYAGIHAGPWALFPSLFSGVAYNDNLYETTHNRVGDAASRTTPTFLAVNDSGVNKLSLYAALDSYFYFHYGREDTINGRLGLQDVWEIQRDLVFKLSGDISRQTDTIDSGQIVGASTVLPLHFWQYQASASLLKSFNPTFVGVGGTFVRQSFDNANQTDGGPIAEYYRDLDVSTIAARAGYYIGPTIYTYAETTANQQIFYNDRLYDSRGYQIVGGLGADQLSLFKGEIYGGYQEQRYSASIGGTRGGAAFGGKIAWLPTEFLSVTANLGESLSTSVASELTPTLASATKTTAANLTIAYALARTWSASAHLNFANSNYIGSSRVDDDWSAGVTLNRRIWENLDATADYQLTRVDSNYANASFTQNVISLGLTYKY